MTQTPNKHCERNNEVSPITIQAGGILSNNIVISDESNNVELLNVADDISLGSEELLDVNWISATSTYNYMMNDPL